jgi:hypothetical protein
MRSEEIGRVAAALGRKVVESRRLAGGFSHETCLLTLDDGQVVARFGGGNPVVEAAVMRAAARAVPVPEVLLVHEQDGHGAPGHDGPQPAGGRDDGEVRPAMVLEFVAGTPLSDVIGSGQADAALGAEVGRTVAAIGGVTFSRPGFFTAPAATGGHLDPDGHLGTEGHLDPGETPLNPGEMPPWSEQMPELIRSGRPRRPSPGWTRRPSGTGSPSASPTRPR